jgi:hypothetical protein
MKRGLWMRILFFVGVSLFIWQSLRTVQRDEPGATSSLPYPASSAITAVSLDWSTHEQLAPGSDNWAVTWADDGHQYASWGDGGGFGGTNSDGRVSLGVARVEGDWNNYTGYNVWGGKNAESTKDPTSLTGKSYGIISVDGDLYMWVSPGSDANNYDEARLAKSTDHALTWAKANWAFTQSDGIVIPTILQYGKDYAGAPDIYIYSYFIRLKDSSNLKVQKPGQIDLVRVPKSQIMDRDAYEFFAGLDGNDNPTWSSNITNRKPVFEDANGVGWNVSVSYNPGLGRYLLMTEHHESFKGNLGIFDAPRPWGPWTTVAYYTNWGGTNTTFFWNFSNKWLSTDGTNFTMVYTGIDQSSDTNDSWNTVRGTFIVVPLDPEAYLPLVATN